MAKPPSTRLPAELENVASLESVNLLEAKIEKCYSSEKYQDFQTDVETIVERYLDTSRAHKKLEDKIDRQIKDYMDDRVWKNRGFWIPTSIAIVSAIAAVVAAAK